MQPGVVPGAVYEFHAARAAGGTGPGINDPLTTQAFDTSLNGNHGTLTNFAGTPWQGTGTAADPNRLDFAGAQYVACGDLGACEDKLYTYEAWIKTTTVNSTIISEDIDGTAYCDLLLDANGYAGVRVNPVAGSTALAGLSAPNVCDGALHHLVGVSDGTKLIMYVDEVAKALQQALPAEYPATVNTTIGAIRVGATTVNPFGGSIPVARIYPFALTPSQVAQNYAAGPLWTGPLGVPVLGGSPFILGGAA